MNILSEKEAIFFKSTFIGRKKELKLLEDNFIDVLNSDGRFTFISGESGIGKTELVDCFINKTIKKTSKKNIKYFKVECNALFGNGTPYQPFIDLLNKIGISKDKKLLKFFRELAPDWMPIIIPLFGGFLAATWKTFFWLKQKTNKRKKESFDNFSLELFAFLDNYIANKDALIIIFDDCQWMDNSSINLLLFLSRHIRNKKILFICIFREIEATETLLKFKNELRQKNFAKEISLSFFSINETGEHIDFIFPGNSFPNLFSEWLHFFTSGNPLFITNYLMRLKNENIIYLKNNKYLLNGLIRNEGTNKWNIKGKLREARIPLDIKQIIENRINVLSIEDKNILKKASIQGKHFNSSALAILLNPQKKDEIWIFDLLNSVMETSKLISHLESKKHCGVLTEYYQFIHALYVEMFYSINTNTEKNQYHFTVARFLEKKCRNYYFNNKLVIEIGYHYEKSKMFVKAAEFFLLAAENSLNIYANIEAVKHGNKVLNLIELSKKENSKDRILEALYIKALEVLEKSYDHLGESKEQQKVLKNMGIITKFYKNDRKLAEVYVMKSWMGVLYDNYTYAKEMALKGLALAETTGDAIPKYKANIITGIAYTELGEFDKPLGYFKKALKLYKNVNIDNKREKFTFAYILYRIGIMFLYTDIYQKALLYFNRALYFSLKGGDKDIESSSLARLGETYRRLGDFKRAEKCLFESLNIKKAISNKWGEGYCLVNIGAFYMELNNYDHAASFLLKARLFAKERFFWSLLIEADSLLSVCYCNNDKWLYCKEIFNLFDEAIKLSNKTNSIQDKLRSLYSASYAMFHFNDVNNATKYLEEGIAIAKQNNISRDIEKFYFLYYKILNKKGDCIKGRKFLKEAFESLNQKQIKIRDKSLRKDFLQNTVINRNIIKEYNKMT